MVDCPTVNDCLTTITLTSYRDGYKQNLPKQLSTIAMRITEHCLIYFLAHNCPQIIIKDNTESIDLNLLFRGRFKPEDNNAQFLINGYEFNLLNVKIEEKAFKGNWLYLCANSRQVDKIDLEKHIIDLDKQIYERNGFWYLGVLTSKYFDDNTDTNRLSFSIPENGDVMFEVSIEQIVRIACTEVESYLYNYLTKIREEKLATIKEYTTKEAPQFRHLLQYMPDEIARIKPALSGDKLDDELYSIKRRFDKKAKNDQKKLLQQIDDKTIQRKNMNLFSKRKLKKSVLLTVLR